MLKETIAPLARRAAEVLHPTPVLSHHRHSGRPLPHQHTSYAFLALLLLITGVLLSVTTAATVATISANRPGPESGTVGVQGTMPAPPPKNAPVITSPRTGQRFGDLPVPVTGICEKGTIIELFTNGIFAGSSPCTDKQTFSIDVGLLYGSNELVARAYDALDQASPESNRVTVFYDAVPPGPRPIDGTNDLESQLLLRASPVYRGVMPKQAFPLPIEIVGGTRPYSVSINWGEGKPSLITRESGGTFRAEHSFSRPGTYEVRIKASDIKGRIAFLSVVIIVNGRAELVGSYGAGGGAGGAGTGGGEGKTQTILMQLSVTWPLYFLALIAVISFWLGEVREKHKLRRHTGAFG